MQPHRYVGLLTSGPVWWNQTCQIQHEKVLGTHLYTVRWAWNYFSDLFFSSAKAARTWSGWQNCLYWMRWPEVVAWGGGLRCWPEDKLVFSGQWPEASPSLPGARYEDIEMSPDRSGHRLLVMVKHIALQCTVEYTLHCRLLCTAL